MNRREFVKKSTIVGISAVLNKSPLPQLHAAQNTIDLAVVKGHDYFNNTFKAVEIVGGLDRFFPANSNIAILANPQGNNPGTFTRPAIVQAVIQMCKSAGAGKIGCIGWLPEINWRNTGIKKVIDQEGVDLIITDLHDESLFNRVPVPGGKIIKEARILKALDQFDLLINVPITKEHSGNNLSGTMKNLMGLNSPQSDQTFHRRDWTMLREDIPYLDQCIADLNTIIHPALHIVDATEFLATNGPYGPGRLIREHKVIAGTDRVAIDTYCATLFGYRPEDIGVLRKAFEHGLGEMDLSKRILKEIEI
jgi:uncharacterized protein (DUF362 family)